MGLKQAAKWATGIVVVGLALLLVSIFIADRQLESPFDEAELGPVEIPAGMALEAEILLYASDVSGNFEIIAGPRNGRGQSLTDDQAFDSWRPRLSPDRRTILFYRTPAGIADTDLTQASLWMMDAQGGEPVEVLPIRSHGWTRQAGAEWSPLGNELVMMGERPAGQQIWITSLDGRDVRNLVNTPGDNTYPSWSPDAKRVLFTACAIESCPDDQREVFAVSASGGEATQITADDVLDEKPRFSPDGSQIVMRSQFGIPDENGQGAVWDIRVIPTNRSQPARRLVDDDTMSDAPMWFDDRTVLFERQAPAGSDAGIYSVRVSDAEISAVLNTTANERFPAN